MRPTRPHRTRFGQKNGAWQASSHSVGPAVAGSSTAFTAEFPFSPSPVEELQSLAPREIIAGYRRSVGATWAGGTVLEP